MTYEQLLELGEKMGRVEKGFNEEEIELLPQVMIKEVRQEHEQKTYDFTSISLITLGVLFVSMSIKLGKL